MISLGAALVPRTGRGPLAARRPAPRPGRSAGWAAPRLAERLLAVRRERQRLRARNRSRKIVLSTRHPSGIVRRLLSPWMRGASKLGTSATLRPARRARMFIMVSISKPRAVELEHRHDPAPEGVVAVAQVGVAAAEEDAGEHREAPVAQPPVPRHVGGAAAGEEPGALDEVGAVHGASRRTPGSPRAASSRRRRSSR